MSDIRKSKEDIWKQATGLLRENMNDFEQKIQISLKEAKERFVPYVADYPNHELVVLCGLMLKDIDGLMEDYLSIADDDKWATAGVQSYASELQRLCRVVKDNLDQLDALAANGGLVDGNKETSMYDPNGESAETAEPGLSIDYDASYFDESDSWLGQNLYGDEEVTEPGRDT